MVCIALLAFIFGIVFITALLVIVFIVPNPTSQQFEVIRIVLALAAGGIAAMIPGFLNLNLAAGSNLALRAGGALAVFAVVYFYSPAHWAPVTPDPPPGPIHVMNREGPGWFKMALFKQRPLELHQISITTEKLGTEDARLLISIGQVIPNCTPEGSNGHVRARLYAHTKFEDGRVDDLLLRDFSRNPTNYSSLNYLGPPIGARVPTYMVLSLEGQCGPELHEPLKQGEKEI